MSSTLRSSKFVRYFTSIARNVVINTKRADGRFIKQSACLNYSLSKTFASRVSTSQTSNDANLDRSLRRLDQYVRRTGRISKSELQDILEELRHTRSATSTQSLLIIRCCGNLIPEESPAVRTQIVEEIWKTLDNIGVPMDISHYNALLRVYLENGHQFSPDDFLADLERKGVEPNRVTFQRLIARYCQQGDIDGATQILESMREKQLPINEAVFNCLIMGHSQAEDMESSAGILGVMQQAGLEPTASTYTALLCGYAKKGDFDAMAATMQECEKKDIQLLDRDYMDIIYSLAVNNHLEHVDKIIEKMRKTAGYNQDAVNFILRLLNAGHEDLAYKILLTMTPSTRTDGEEALTGVFFIRQLVRSNYPVEKIKTLCEKLELEALNPKALSIATESSLQSGNIGQACALLQVMNEKNFPIRQHYFWPLLAKNRNNVENVIDILSLMCNKFNLPAGGDTLRDYVIPSFENKSSEEIVNILKTSGVTTATAASAVVMHNLSKNALAEAAKVAMRYRAHYSASLMRRPLVQAYIKTEDLKSFLTVLRQIHDSVDRAPPLDEDASPLPDRAEIAGNFVVDVAYVGRTNRPAMIEAVLQGLLDQGLGLSNSAAERLQDKLGEELTNEISTLLGKLTSGDLVPSTIRQPSSVAMDGRQEGRDQYTPNVKRQQFNNHCRNKDVEGMEQLLKEFERDNFVLTGGMYAQLLEFYCHHEKLEDVNRILKTLKEKIPDFNLDHTKIIKIASLLVKNDNLPDAVQFLIEQAREYKFEDRSFQYSGICWRLLNSLAETGKVDELKQVFDTLVKHNYIDVSNVLLGPLVKVHIVRNDLQGAMEQFEWCCQKYRATPWKNDLACKMIQSEDAASLQKLTDLSTQVHGEVNSLYDLVFAFVECGRIRQARKILETPGLRSRPHRLNSACERYRQEGLVAPLEGLVEATRDILHIDRADIYYHLLLSYCRSKDIDKALGLWTRMQEEDVQPSDEFLSTLGNFLKEEGREVPFVIPEVAQPSQPSESGRRRKGALFGKLRRALMQGNLETELEVKQK